MEESERAREELLPEAGETVFSVSAGDIFGLVGEPTLRERIRAQITKLGDSDLGSFLLYKVLTESKAEIVVDCVNTATGLADRDMSKAAEAANRIAEAGELDPEAVDGLLESLYMPRLIRHIQVMYRG